MTHRVDPTLPHPLSSAEIINALADHLSLSAQRSAHPEILVSQGPFAKSLPRQPKEIRWSVTLSQQAPTTCGRAKWTRSPWTTIDSSALRLLASGRKARYSTAYPLANVVAEALIADRASTGTSSPGRSTANAVWWHGSGASSGLLPELSGGGSHFLRRTRVQRISK